MTTSAPKPKMKAWKKGLIFVGILWFGAIALTFLVAKPDQAPSSVPPKGGDAVRTASAASAPAAVAPQDTEVPLPAAEKWFVSTVLAFRGRYQSAANDMAKGAVRVARGNALCDPKHPIHATDRRVTDWIGTVKDLDSVGDGRGVLVVRIAPHITVGTTNNALSEKIGDYKTLIPVGSAAYKNAVTTHVGERVVFSGTMFPSKTDCVAEQSLTMDGSMGDPEFLFRFTRVGDAR